jgi:hypothetical protein
MDSFVEAAAAPEGFIEVDLLTGATSGWNPFTGPYRRVIAARSRAFPASASGMDRI